MTLMLWPSRAWPFLVQEYFNEMSLVAWHSKEHGVSFAHRTDRGETSFMMLGGTEFKKRKEDKIQHL